MYTFELDASGNVVVKQNGQRITTATPSYATQKYGYNPNPVSSTTPTPTPAPAPTPPPSSTISYQQTPSGSYNFYNPSTGSLIGNFPDQSAYNAYVKANTPQIPAQTPVAPPNPYAGAASYTGPSIVDFLNMAGQPSDQNSRIALGAKYGIDYSKSTTNYATENRTLLNVLKELAKTGSATTAISSAANTAASYLPAPTTSNTITPQGMTTSGTPYTLPTTTSTGNTAIDSYIAGIQAQMKTAQAEYTAAKTKTDAETTRISQMMNDLISGGGPASIQNTAEQAAGVPAAKAALNTVNGQIATKMAEYQALTTDVQGKPITMASIIGAQAQIKNVAAAEIGMLQAQAQVLQGNLTLAQETANKAVDIQYNDKIELIKLYQSQLELIRPDLTAAEQKIADLREAEYNMKMDALNLQIANEKDQVNTLLNLINEYPDAGISTKDSLETAQQKITSNSKIYQDEIKSANAGASGVTSKGQSVLTPDGLLNSRTQQVLDGFINVSSLTPTEQQKVRDDLFAMGFGSSQAPQWFIDYLQNERQMSILPAVVDEEWIKYRDKILGASTTSSGGSSSKLESLLNQI